MISLVSLLFLYLSGYASAQSKYQKSPEQRGGNEIIPGRYIVEFSNDGQLRVQVDPVEGFYNVLSAEGIEVTPQVNITSMVFFGTSFTTASDDNNIAAEIAALEGVARIWPVRRIPRAIPEIHEVGEKTAPAWRNTGVLDLHEQGILGEGIIVAIVDTEIDYTHPSLGGGFGPAFKVVGGTNIVGDNYQGAGFFPDPDPYDCGGHGTHVAGIVAGKDKNFVGVAPRAKLLVYKVFGCRYDGTGEDVLIQAFYASSGATGVDVTSVASIANEEYFAEALEGDGTRRNIAYLQSEDTPDLSKYLVVVRRGGCQFDVKERNLVEKNATYIWFYNTPKTPIVMEFIVEQFANSGNVTVNFPREFQGVGINNTLTGGKMSPFTSWGPSFEAQIKSEIGAPGGYIYSTIPLKQGPYAVFSGTSMASPYIAGAAALYMSKFGGRKKLGYAGVLQLKNRIITSGTLVNWNDGAKTDPTRSAPVSKQGAGYVSALKVLTYTTTLSPGKLELNDIANFKPEHTITIQNSGNQEVTYSFTHEVAGTVNTFKQGSKVPQTFPPTFVNGSATLQFLPQNVMVPARSNGTFKVTFTPPKNLKTTLLPVYSGKVVVTSYEETLSIPYQGIHGSLRDIREPTTVTLSGDDLLTAVFANNFGSPEIRWDVVAEGYDPKKFVYPPADGERGFVGSVRTLEERADFPITYEPRHNSLGMEITWFNWGGGLVNGGMIADGRYRLAFMALRVAGDRRKVEDWETVITEVVTVASGP
ncbi:subtilisin-like serine protease [Tuber brumale]|nr:subtilisin-like serine protease [Tuber brumale]